MTVRLMSMLSIAMVFAASSAHAACDAATELAAISPAFQAKVQELSADPTAENMTRIQAMTTKLNDAGTAYTSGDQDTGCALYAELKEELGITE